MEMLRSIVAMELESHSWQSKGTGLKFSYVQIKPAYSSAL